MIRYTTQIPRPELKDYVRFFWTLDVEVGSSAPFVHRALPDNCLEMIFYCRGAFSITSPSGGEGNTFQSGVFGQAQQFRQFKTSNDFTLFGVYLYPHSFKTIFNLPADELTNQMVDIESLWGIAGKILEERIILAANNVIRIALFSEFMLNHIRKKSIYDSAFPVTINRIVDNNTLLSIPTFASECNLSRRQFERKFAQYSGFTPKDFLRLVRFQRAVSESTIRNRSLAQIATDSGYYDQSHFTNEFRNFSGYTPGEFFTNCSAETDSRATREFKI
jgi:AraC-like DNA-binding protein